MNPRKSVLSTSNMIRQGSSIMLLDVLRWSVRGDESVRCGARSRMSNSAMVSFYAPLVQMPL